MRTISLDIRENAKSIVHLDGWSIKVVLGHEGLYRLEIRSLLVRSHKSIDLLYRAHGTARSNWQ